ncbi:MAG TPA: histone deacetylase [candidate division WOR-3 bacterium]|uniref:Histone deacetylase n=1 Tax=candidate division WOR-3 bacterium TaxID=2052148 RepID=A0A9C9JZT8_UNCW3|nr:histone deacetylase [candidate division WOR-3 bacterium]
MDFVFSWDYRVDIGVHVFRTEKYGLIHDKLKEEGIITESNLFEPEMPDRDDLLKIVSEEYLDDLLNIRLTARTFPSEMPVNKAIIEAQRLCCGGSFLAAQRARKGGACYHIGGGFHHAFYDHAEGFCYFNDVVFAAVKMLEQGIGRIAVIDCDLHQGNGTARFFQDEKRVFTFSIHQEYLYPKKERSDLDIGLDMGVGDDEYLSELNRGLDALYENFMPELIIYLAGADPYVFDQLGNLRLTIDGLKKRDETVVRRAFDKKIPLAVVLGGGYAEMLDDTVEIHCNTARVIHEQEKKDN